MAQQLFYHLPQDRYNRLYSRMLLRDEWRRQCSGQGTFPDLHISHFGKPFLYNAPFHFNISYSDSYVVCVFCKEEIGIDIERIRAINVHDFRNMFTSKEWEALLDATNPSFDFFNLWTKKEAIMKAEGKGFNLDPRDIQIGGSWGIGVKRWYLKQWTLDQKYTVCIATKTPIQLLSQQEGCLLFSY